MTIMANENKKPMTVKDFDALVDKYKTTNPEKSEKKEEELAVKREALKEGKSYLEKLAEIKAEEAKKAAEARAKAVASEAKKTK